MNSLAASALRTAVLATTFFFLPAFASAKNSSASDHASELFSANGSLAVKAAGPYVEVGTYQIQVSTKLGQPNKRLADGTWLYENFLAADSAACGTLVVRFNPEGRVRELSLATPAVVAALSASPKSKDALVLVASRTSR